MAWAELPIGGLAQEIRQQDGDEKGPEINPSGFKIDAAEIADFLSVLGRMAS